MTPIRYATSLWTFYIKGEIKDEHNFIVLRMPNTILGFIPQGAKTNKVPISQVASTSTNFRMNLKSFLAGLLGMFVGLGFLGKSPVFGIIMLLWGFGTFIDAFEIDLVVTTTGGQDILVDFLIFEKAKAALASDEINDIVSGRLDDTNVREQTDRINENSKAQTDRIVDAINRR